MAIEERHIRWRNVIENQATSGMNILSYCRETNIGTSLFYTLRRKIREQPPTGGFVELKAGGSGRNISGFRICLGKLQLVRGFVNHGMF